MAEAYLNHQAAKLGAPVKALSAGTSPTEKINAMVLKVMAELGIPMATQTPKLLTAKMASQATKIITMGCGVEGDMCPAGVYFADDWGLDDPAGQSIETVRKIRDQIIAHVDALLRDLRK
ncbi:arsenate reductase ArsC [soil metagenome]